MELGLILAIKDLPSMQSGFLTTASAWPSFLSHTSSCRPSSPALTHSPLLSGSPPFHQLLSTCSPLFTQLYSPSCPVRPTHHQILPPDRWGWYQLDRARPNYGRRYLKENSYIDENKRILNCAVVYLFFLLL